MVKVSPLKLTLILLIVNESKPEELLRNLTYYTLSSSIQVIAMLESLKKTKFIEFIAGAYVLTPNGYAYLSSKGLESIQLEDLLVESSEINEEWLHSYIPIKR